MSFDRIWSNYVLHTLDNQKLDQMIINLKCDIPGCRTRNKKSLKGIHPLLKVSILSKRPLIHEEVIKEVEKLFESFYKKEELARYYEMTASEFLEQIDDFKQNESQGTQLAVVNYFMKASSTEEDDERDNIVKHFNISQKETKDVKVSEQVIKETILESEVKPSREEKEPLTRKEAKDLKILRSLYDEVKQREKQQEQKIKELYKEVERVSKAYDEQEEAYKKESKDFKYAIEKLEEAYKKVKDENTDLTSKIKKVGVGLPYVFLGSPFVKSKLEDLKYNAYPEAHAIYISTKQWENRLGKEKHEVEEVYAFYYDIEWFLREALYEQYQEKLKIFPSDEHFEDYIKQHWGA